jgi:hypothetical protein
MGRQTPTSLNGFHSVTSFSGIELPQFRPWREIAVGALMVMSLCWGVVWFRAFANIEGLASEVRTFLVFAAILFSAHSVVRLINFLNLKRSIRQGVMVSLLLVEIGIGIKQLLYPYEELGLGGLFEKPILTFRAIGVIIPGEFLIVFVVLLLWWHGIGLAGKRISPQTVLVQFKWGFSMFLSFIILRTFEPVMQIQRAIYFFLFAAMMAMTSARISTLRYGRGGKANVFDKRWLAGILVASLGLLSLAIGVVALVGEANTFLLRVVTILWMVVILIVLLLTAPVIVIALGILEWLIKNPGQALRETILAVVETITSIIITTIELLQAAVTALFEQLAEAAQNPIIVAIIKTLMALRWVVLAAGILGVLFGILWIAGRKLLAEEGSSGNVDESKESLLDGDNWLRMLKALFKRQVERLEAIGQFLNIGRDQGVWAAARVRRIYAKLLRLCEKLESTRPEAQTPNEFLSTLKMLFPMHYQELELITAAYNQVRYGKFPERDMELRSIEEAWQRVRIQGEQELKYRKEQAIAKRKEEKRQERDSWARRRR